MTGTHKTMASLDLPDSWYPVCRSEQLTTSRPFAVRAFGQDWVLFRTGQEHCSAVQRYCCHMGTDLALGQVIECELQCPAHHWRFNAGGKCVGIPASKVIPARAKLVSRPCVERFGMIFIRHGGNDVFEFPAFEGIDSLAHSRAKLISMPSAYETVSLNLFDVQHLITVHQRELQQPAEMFSIGSSHLGIRYSVRNIRERLGNRLARWLGMSANHIRVDCWGGNLLLVTIKGNRPSVVMALMPIDSRSSQLYLATVESSRSNNTANGWAQRLKLELAVSLTRAFVSEDIRMLSNARTSMGVLLPDIDVEAARFWSYWEELARSGPRVLP